MYRNYGKKVPPRSRASFMDYFRDRTRVNQTVRSMERNSLLIREDKKNPTLDLLQHFAQQICTSPTARRGGEITLAPTLRKRNHEPVSKNWTPSLQIASRAIEHTCPALLKRAGSLWPYGRLLQSALLSNLISEPPRPPGTVA
jgi:hypothetical protein